MTAPAYATNLTTFWLEGSTTVSAIGSGGAGLGNPETDFFIQGSDSISKQAWTNATKGFIIDALGTTFTVPTDGAIIGFIKYDAQGSLDTQANGGLRMIVGSAVGAYDEFYIGGKDTIAYNSWVPYAIDPNTATPDVSNSGGAERWVGTLGFLPSTSGPTKGSPIGMDAIRYGRCDIEYTLGDTGGGGPATFSGAEAVANADTARWGLLELLDGAYQTRGFHSIGISGTAVDFRDSDKVLFWRKEESNGANDAVSTAFHRVEIIHASTICQWTNIIWAALGTRTKGTFVHTAGTCDFTNCQLIDWNTFTFLAAANILSSVFTRVLSVTAPGTIMTGSQIIAPTAAVDGAGFIYDVATEPDGKLDNMIFEMGANDHHAIDFGTNFDSSLVSVTLRGINFNGFGAVDDANASTIRFLATTGALTLNLIDCLVDGAGPIASGGSQNFSVDDAAGMTVTVVVAPVDLQMTVFDTATLLPIEDAQSSIYLLDSPFTELMNEDTTASGIAAESYAGAVPVDIKWRVRKSDEADDPRYTPRSGIGEIDTGGFTLAVGLTENPIFPEPPPPTVQAILQSGGDSGAASGKTLSESPTLVAGTNRKLLMFTSFHDSTGTATLVNTYDSGGMTLVAAGAFNGTSDQQCGLYYYDIPDGDSGVKTIGGGTATNRTDRDFSWVIIDNCATGAVDASAVFVDSFGGKTQEDTILTNTSADAMMFQLMADIGSGSAYTAGTLDTLERNVAGAAGQSTIVHETYTATASQTVEVTWTFGTSVVKGAAMILKA